MQPATQLAASFGFGGAAACVGPAIGQSAVEVFRLAVGLQPMRVVEAVMGAAPCGAAPVGSVCQLSSVSSLLGTEEVVVSVGVPCSVWGWSSSGTIWAPQQLLSCLREVKKSLSPMVVCSPCEVGMWWLGQAISGMR